MPKLGFEIDWVDAQGVSGPELCATWASLRMLVGDSAVTRVLDARAQTVREFVYVPLYPLAEWLVTNWWFLSYEIATPAKEGDPDFHRRHALNANREGYAFPNLAPVRMRCLPGLTPSVSSATAPLQPNSWRLRQGCEAGCPDPWSMARTSTDWRWSSAFPRR